jgi:hypothetical protein
MRYFLITTGLLTAGALSATEYVFQNFDAVIRDRLGIVWGTQLDVEIGAFSSGFTPTLQNYGSWRANFVTESSPGYYVGPALGGPEFSATLHLADNSLLAAGTQLKVWVHTSTGFAGGAQTALFSDTSWLVVTNSPTDVLTRYYDFSGITSATFGTIDFNNNLASTVAVTSIPEPSTYGLFFGLPCLGLALLSRRRRSR